MKYYDLIAVGDTTQDTFLKIDDASVHCHHGNAVQELCLQYGEKIGVAEAQQNPGGNAANVSVGAAMLGMRTGLLATIGNDTSGEFIRTRLRARGVDTTLLQRNRSYPTNVGVILGFQRERTILIKKYPTQLVYPKRFPNTRWVYLSSVHQPPKTVYVPLLRLKKKHGFCLAFNPSRYQLEYPDRSLSTLLPEIDVLFVNMQEAKKIVVQAGQKTNILPGVSRRDIRELLDRIHTLGVQRVCITDGVRGAYGTDGKTQYHMPIVDLGICKDRTGCGDAFAAGTVSALATGVEFPECMRWGALQAAAVVREVGAQNGLLTLSEMKRFLKKVKVMPRVF